MIERHEEWSDLAPVYVLGGLEAEEVAAFEAHLAHCDSCRQEVRELQEVTGFLPLAAEPVAPPPGMRARVLGNVLGHAQQSAKAKPAAPAKPEAPAVLQEDLAPQQEAAQPGQGLPPETAVPAARVEEAAQAQPWQPQGRARARSSRAWRVASAALAAAALVLGIYAGQLQGQINSLKQQAAGSSAAQEQLAQAQAQNALLQERLASAMQPAQGMQTGEAVRLNPATQDIVAQGLATIVIDSKGTHLVVQAENLPTLEGDEAFQVWLIKGDTPQNAGTFLSRDGTGAVYYTLDSANDYDTVAITLEPDAMGKEPRGTMILAAKIKG
ncbi:anti-sigma factor [Paenibacillus sp. JNUCC31]|uniref:anti-sigma factor n=1 Tax=Paenibacillus sp. JNUCC-31 TaxID=2777983 RepID=UPI00177A8B85|nr:anti-sigma factor [Paenibacillus sp. JNUCC-31]QOS76631.1 anti-sigma factor [Paenibacillus sp. JNUCC-31]